MTPYINFSKEDEIRTILISRVMDLKVISSQIDLSVYDDLKQMATPL